MSGTASHTKICLNNKGMKRVNSYGNGDHYVHIKIAVPKKLTKEQKALMQVSSPCPNATTPDASLPAFSFVRNCSHSRHWYFRSYLCRHTQNWKVTHPARYLASHSKPTVSHLVGRRRRRRPRRRDVRPPKIFPKNSHKVPSTRSMNRTIKVAVAKRQKSDAKMKKCITLLAFA